MEKENIMDIYLVFASNSAECCAIVEAHKTLCNISLISKHNEVKLLTDKTYLLPERKSAK